MANEPSNHDPSEQSRLLIGLSPQKLRGAIKHFTHQKAYPSRGEAGWKSWGQGWGLENWSLIYRPNEWFVVFLLINVYC